MQKAKSIPTAPASVFTVNEFPNPRPDSGNLLVDEPELKDWITPDYLHLTTAQILSAYFEPDDLMCATIQAMGPQVDRFKELQPRIQNFVSLDPNPRKMDETPARKILVTTFPGKNIESQGRRISYLRRYGALTLLCYNIFTNELTAWWNVAGLTPKQTQAFFKRACELDADPRQGLRGRQFAVPSGVRTSGLPIFTQMKAWGLVPDIDAFNRIGLRNFVLWHQPPAKGKSK